MKKATLLFLSFIIPVSFLFAQTIAKGKITDNKTGEAIAFSTISERLPGNITVSDREGNFRLALRRDTGSIFISLIGYRTQQVAVSHDTKFLDIRLDHGPVDLKAVTISSNINNNSFHTISSIDLNTRPVNSSQDLMRFVPGLFLGQHQGGGIAEHIFFRGFDADHGTDVNVSVDGMPQNLVSHIHGQGFADLHYLIPELVTNYEYGKGPYYSEYGDFTTAGYIAFQTRDVLDKNVVKLEAGPFHTARAMTMLNILSDRAKRKGESAYISGEAAYTDGAFDWRQHLKHFNLYGKYNLALSPKSKLKLTLSTFSSKWRSSGEIPERAVDEGLVGRFGYIDSAQGGSTARTNTILKITTVLSEKTFLENQAYYTRYNFDLHYNPTFFADDSINGDQLRQKEARNVFGYNGKLTHHGIIGRNTFLTSSFGAGWQLNKIYNSELSHTINENTVLDYLQLGDISETAFNGYIDVSLQKNKWLFNFGSRLDYLYFDYRDKLASQQPARNKRVLSPKVNIQYSFSKNIQVYLKSGKGFHSNDSKVVVADQGNEILPAAYGTDLGLNWKPAPHLFVNAALWYLYLEQEFVYDADEGTIEPGTKTRRKGADLSARYQFNPWLFGTLDLNTASARNTGAVKGSNYLPLAVPLSGTGGLEFKCSKGWNGALSYRYMKDRPANEDNSLTAKGYFITDLTVNYTKKNYEIGLEIQNLLNAKWREAQFETESRLKNEPAPVDDVSFTPGTPFFAKLKLAVFF